MAEKRGQKGPKRPKLSADIELEFTPKRVPKTVVRRKKCYQPHGHLVCDAPAPVNNNSVPVCTLRSTPRRSCNEMLHAIAVVRRVAPPQRSLMTHKRPPPLVDGNATLIGFI